MKKKLIIFIIILLLVLSAFIGIEIVINKISVPDIDQLKIKTLSDDFRSIYSNFSHNSIQIIQKKHEKTFLNDVMFFSSRYYSTQDILLIAYWKNIYKDKVFFVILYNDGSIVSKSWKI